MFMIERVYVSFLNFWKLEFLLAGRAENCQWEGCRGTRDSSFFRTNTPNCWI
jgi:hypothetical protein